MLDLLFADFGGGLTLFEVVLSVAICAPVWIFVLDDYNKSISSRNVPKPQTLPTDDALVGKLEVSGAVSWEDAAAGFKLPDQKP